MHKRNKANQMFNVRLLSTSLFRFRYGHLPNTVNVKVLFYTYVIHYYKVKSILVSETMHIVMPIH